MPPPSPPCTARSRPTCSTSGCRRRSTCAWPSWPSRSRSSRRRRDDTKVLDNDPPTSGPSTPWTRSTRRPSAGRTCWEIYRRKGDRPTTTADKVKLLLQQARLCERQPEDRATAVACDESVLESDERNAEATAALERLYAEAERWSPPGVAAREAAGVAGVDVLALRQRAADTVLEKLGDPPRASSTTARR